MESLAVECSQCVAVPPWCALLLLIVGFILGRLCSSAQCGTGSAHLDTWLSYVRLHVWNRREALQLTWMFQMIGLPVELTSEQHLVSLTAVGSMAIAAVVSRLSWARRIPALAQKLSGTLCTDTVGALM